MYRIDNRPEAIRRVQEYLAVAGNPNIFVAPTGVYDENTRLSVIDFQGEMDIPQSGVVDYETFTLLYDEYVLITNKKRLNNRVGTFIKFPLFPGVRDNSMRYINNTMADLLDYYGVTHSLRDSRFYTDETSMAVLELRKIYLLDEVDIIDEELYMRLISDRDSMGRFKDNFSK